MYSEDELIPISALQHLMFCERQCALIHLERAWEENRFTAEGRILHERVEEGENESRGNIRIERSVPLRSLCLGIVGIADVVEFHRNRDGWIPFPVEYKRGRPKEEPWDDVQLCAQAMCLEEMLDVKIAGGALYYGKTRRRKEVSFEEMLREETEKATRKAHELMENKITPKAEFGEKCRSCSIMNLCQPKSSKRYRSARRYLSDVIRSGDSNK